MNSVAWLVVFVALSAACCWSFSRHADRGVRLLFGTFAVSYVLTTVVGATIMGLAPYGGPLLLLVGGDTSELDATAGLLYWFLLYAPLIFVPLALRLISVFQRRQKLTAGLPTHISPLAFVAVLVGFLGYCLFALVHAGGVGGLLEGLKSMEWDTVIENRTALFSSLGTGFYGVVYMSLPAMSCIALFQMLRTKQAGWVAAFALAVLGTCALSFSTLMKGPLFLYLLSLAFGYSVIGRLRISSLVAGMSGGFVALTLWQGFFSSGWTAARSLLYIFGRVSTSHPYYVSLFPKVVPYLGGNFGLALFGFGGVNNDNLIVFDHMYPRITFVQGAAAGAAHLRAYAQGGITESMASLAIIALIISTFGRVKTQRQNPLTFALYVQGFLLCYYLTQSSVRSVLVEGFSIVFGLIAIGGVWIADLILKTALSNGRNAVRSPMTA